MKTGCEVLWFKVAKRPVRGTLKLRFCLLTRWPQRRGAGGGENGVGERTGDGVENRGVGIMVATLVRLRRTCRAGVRFGFGRLPKAKRQVERYGLLTE